jgi:mannose-6-phosphate isomerase
MTNRGKMFLDKSILSVSNKTMNLTRNDHVFEEDHRPWGYYQVILDEPDLKIKKIFVYPGKRLSLQRHQHRSEHWYIIRGQALVTLDLKDRTLKESNSVDIPQGSLHRIMNSGIENLAFIEVQTGDYFGEDDIERLEDDYGRVP